MTTPQPTRTILYFGATGGVTLSTLTTSLLSPTPHLNICLVRTPSKLHSMLSAASIPATTLSDPTRLLILEGNAKNPTDVANALTNWPSTIVYGIGGAPVYKPPFSITVDDPHVCEGSITAILSTIKTKLAEDATRRPPFISVISTTGLDPQVNDVPLLLKPLYSWLLAVPHEDKKKLEAAVVAAGKEGTVGG
ncbi:hypothetical protein BJ508DRAFT_365466, partial [Ascobolus immersus RN42]